MKDWIERHIKSKRGKTYTHEYRDKRGKRVSKKVVEGITKGLYIPEMIWDEQVYQSEDSILLSVCSTKYNKDDYITNWKDFINAS